MPKPEEQKPHPLDGYTWNENAKVWQQVLEDKEITLEDLGTGNFKRIHHVDDDLRFAKLTDSFVNSEERFLLRRTLSPYFHPRLVGVRIQAVDPTGKLEYDSVDAEFFRDEEKPDKVRPSTQSHLAISLYGSYRTSFNNNGELDTLNFNPEGDGPFVSFRFREDQITDSDDNELGTLSEVLNTNKGFLFNERKFTITRMGNQVIARCGNPTKDIREGKRVLAPTSINMKLVSKILTAESEHWLGLHKHIPIKTL